MAGIGLRAPARRNPPGWTARLVHALPQGRGLPAADWERRHRGLLLILWLHVLAIPAFGVAQGYSVPHSLAEGAALVVAALAAKVGRLGQRLRSGAVCLGLLTASGLLVHFSGGYIEFHFHFFVMIALLALYVDWFPFLLSVAYVLGHHGLVGVLDPDAVYNHPDAIAAPWKWAGIHAAFVLAAGAASIFTWRVSEEETRRRTNIERVTEAALAKLPLVELLDELLARISEVVDAEMAAIWLRENGGLVLRSVHGVDEAPARIRLSTDEGFHADVLAAQRAVALTEVDPETFDSPIHRTHGTRAIAGVPLVVEGALIGVLDVASAQPRQFSATDLDLLQLVADRIGPAIDRARLYEQEHRIATTLQRSLLPKRLPDVAGVEMAAAYLPAGDQISVGGDWYDAMELGQGRVGLVMGDVAGHGSEAAALMGQLRTGLRAYANEGHAPEAVVTRLNALLAGLEGDSMATLLYIELDLRASSGRLVAAGHPPPLLLAPDGGCAFLEGGRSAPLGATGHTRYVAEDFEFPSGASLVLYTDGLVERRGVPLRTSLETLCERLAGNGGHNAETVCETLTAASRAEGPLADDVAVLVLRRAAIPAEQLTVELPAEPASMPAIRRRLEYFLRGVGASSTEIYEVVTSAAEACANAIQHAYGARDGAFLVTAALADGGVELTVSDRGAWRPPSNSDLGGRGLLMMRELMDDVRIDRTPQGTRVTLTRALGERAASPHG